MILWVEFSDGLIVEGELFCYMMRREFFLNECNKLYIDVWGEFEIFMIVRFIISSFIIFIFVIFSIIINLISGYIGIICIGEFGFWVV